VASNKKKLPQSTFQTKIFCIAFYESFTFYG
jgi:hypothetical protein